jgi:hypothetical protein
MDASTERQLATPIRNSYDAAHQERSIMKSRLPFLIACFALGAFMMAATPGYAACWDGDGNKIHAWTILRAEAAVAVAIRCATPSGVRNAA